MMTGAQSLTLGSVRSWRRDGFVLLPNVLGPAERIDLAGWIDEFESSVSEVLREQDGTSMPTTRMTDSLSWLLRDGVLVQSGAELLGEPITLVDARFDATAPGGAGFASRQDAATGRFDDSNVTCMITIDAATVENGCLEFVAGCHSDLLVDDGKGFLPDSVERALRWRAVEMQAGDVLWWHGCTPYRSGRNESERPRRAVVLTFRPVGQAELHADADTDGAVIGRPAPSGVSTIDVVQPHASSERPEDTHDTDDTEGQTAMTDGTQAPGSDPTRREPNVEWMNLTTSSDVAAALIDLYERRGSTKYDEAVTQTEHAMQSGHHAIENGASLDAIVAAFLHDIGHLLLDERGGSEQFRERDLHHEDIGARFLANWFGAGVTEPIRLHVPAKRYLCAVEPGYNDGLSTASVHSLEMQGGPMNSREVDAFVANAQHATAVELRRWDDWAKVPDAPTPSLDTFRTLIESVARVRPSPT